MTTLSLIQDRDLDLANQYAAESYREFFDESVPLWSQSLPTLDGRLLSPHNLGLSILVLPAYLLGGLNAVKGFLGLIGGVALACAFLLATQTTHLRHWPLVSSILLGISAPFFVYATQIYPEMPAALCVVLLALLGLRQDHGVARAILAALLLAALMWLGVKYAPIAITLACTLVIALGARGRFALVAVLVPLGIHYGWFHIETYGDWTPYAVNFVYAGSTTPELLARHVEIGDRAYRLVGLWIDREFGLVRWAPILALAFPGAWLIARRSGRVGRALLLPIVVQVLVAAFLTITMRGWWFPGRMLIVVLPLFVPLLTATLALSGRSRWLASLSLALGLATLASTTGFWWWASQGEVTVAVNPFEVPGGWLEASNPLFPLYTAYRPETLLLTAAWAVAAAALVVAVLHIRSASTPSQPARASAAHALAAEQD